MDNYILLLVCFFGGMLLARSPTIPEGSHKLLSQIVIRISLPALAVHALSKLHLDSSLWAAAAMPWAMFAISTVFFTLLGRSKGWTREQVGTLALLGGVGNTSFVGIPLLAAVLGPESTPVAVLLDQAGTFLVLSALGLSVASYFAGSMQFSLAGSIKRTAVYPPFLGLMAGLALAKMQWALPHWAAAPIEAVARTTIPLAVIAVGMQMSVSGVGKELGRLAWGLGYKLAAAPALAFLAIWLAGSGFGLAEKTIVLEAAMGPSIAAGIVASQAGLDSRLATLMLGVGIPACAISVPALAWLLGWL